MTDYGALEYEYVQNMPLYQLLGNLDSEQKVMNSRPQRKALASKNGEIWVQPSGCIVCAHGNTRKTLLKMSVSPDAKFKSAGIVRCNCKLSVPRRMGSIFVTTCKKLALTTTPT